MDLAGLVARDGARRLELNLLPATDATALLRALIGARAEADPVATAALAGQCARLPLALRIAAELATARPALPLAELVDELADEQRRLDLLDAGGDARTAVRGVFSWSCHHLPADAARAFRLASLHPGPDFDAHALAAISRVFARTAAIKVGEEGMRWLCGSEGIAEAEMKEFEAKLRLSQIHQAQAGLLTDMDKVADVLYERTS